MATLPPAAIADPYVETMPADNYAPNTNGLSFGEAAIARAENEAEQGGSGFVFDGTQWKPLR